MKEQGLRLEQHLSLKNLRNLGLNWVEHHRGLESKDALKSAIQTADWSKIAPVIRKYPIEVQTSLTQSFLGEGWANFPNPQLVAEKLVTLNNMAWLSPREEPDRNWLEQTVGKISSRLEKVWKEKGVRLDLGLRLITDISRIPPLRGNVQQLKALRMAGLKVQDVAIKNGRRPAIQALRDSVWGIIPNPLSEAAKKQDGLRHDLQQCRHFLTQLEIFGGLLSQI